MKGYFLFCPGQMECSTFDTGISLDSMLLHGFTTAFRERNAMGVTAFNLD